MLFFSAAFQELSFQDFLRVVMALRGSNAVTLKDDVEMAPAPEIWRLDTGKLYTPIRSGRFRNPKANHLGCIKPVNSGINCQPQLVQDFSYQQYLKTGKNIFWQTSCLASMLVFRVVLGHAWFYDFWNHHDLFFLQDPEEQVGKSWIHSIFCGTPNILNYPDIYQVVVSKICFLWPRYLGRWSNLTNMFFFSDGWLNHRVDDLWNHHGKYSNLCLVTL